MESQETPAEGSQEWYEWYAAQQAARQRGAARGGVGASPPAGGGPNLDSQVVSETPLGARGGRPWPAEGGAAGGFPSPLEADRRSPRLLALAQRRAGARAAEEGGLSGSDLEVSALPTKRAPAPRCACRPPRANTAARRSQKKSPIPGS